MFELPETGIKVRYSVGTRRGLGKTIEYWGIAPTQPTEADRAEVAAGRNSTLERAAAYLRRRK